MASVFNQLINDVNDLKEMQRNSEYQFRQQVTSEFKRRQRTEVQPEDLLGMHVGVVVDTVDPLKQGRVRFYTPSLDLRETETGGLPWANPVSSFGGFDDSGAPWVPPAGSKVVIFFHNGNRNAPYYFGTIWHRHRGPDGQHLPFWDNCPIPEYDQLWSGRRGGYYLSGNDGDQVLPPWNTESYNGYDTDSVTEFYNDPAQYSSITNPYVKGIKTEEKHYLKFVEGDPRCNRRWKRLELVSSRGNGIVFKDDHLHPAGQWCFGGAAGDDISNCHVGTSPKEFACCAGDKSSPADQCAANQCPQQDVSNPSIDRSRRFANPYYKRREEMRLYTGPNTPQANKCDLEQSGIHVQSLSGHQIVMDDAVNQPTGVPSWDRDFDFGCDDTFRGRVFMKSATGHVVELDDTEDVGSPRVRGENNGIRMRTASGISIEMNDHTLAAKACQPGRAGERRGITMTSSSRHLFQMIDHRLDQSSPTRRDGGEPAKAEKGGFRGFCMLRSGYGLQLLMRDEDRQDKTANQFILLQSPQRDNHERGPHMLAMQEQASGPGMVMLRAGGVYHVSSYDDSMEVVGQEGHAASKFMSVSDSYIVDVKNLYFNHSDLAIMQSESYIFLLAGRDCPNPDSETTQAAQDGQAQSIASAQQSPGTSSGQSKGPCIYNVLVAKDPWVCPFTNYVHYGIMAGEDGPILDSRSTRVYASSGE